eukprot:scaffold153720_cov31-Tisochrysis_lutea.AAC.6
MSLLWSALTTSRGSGSPGMLRSRSRNAIWPARKKTRLIPIRKSSPGISTAERSALEKRSGENAVSRESEGMFANIARSSTNVQRDG